MPNILLVMLGGAAGAGLRYEVGRLSLAHIGPGFPWGTLIVNLLGGLLIGLLAGWLLAGQGDQRPVSMLLAVGLLGGFTTFSAFSLDLFLMIERGQAGIALAYAAASVAGSVILLCLGFWAARAAA
jgi:CrcB protein